MSPETLRTWVRKNQIDAGSRSGITSDEQVRLKQLERENKDLRRANANLKDASIFFASEPGAQTRKKFATSIRERIGGGPADLQSFALCPFDVLRH
jgi:transposase